MHFITTDVFRAGAAEQLRLYASILGVGFQTVETPLALAQALEEQRRKDLIFIDTPGWGTRDLPEMRELAACIAEDPDIDVHLVLPASNRACDIGRMTERYAIFQPAKLIITRLDETQRCGVLLNQSRSTGKPVSFLCAGEQIPEDLEPATVERIRDMLLGARENSPSEEVN
jgi:flagellar biosynthesis protein FlhF